VKPGKYKVTLGKHVRTELWQVADVHVFEVVALPEMKKEGA
jgi:hypothetical protein